jgi:hypothetical protein
MFASLGDAGSNIGPTTPLRPVGAVSLATVLGVPHPHQLDEIIDATGRSSSIATRWERLDLLYHQLRL